MNTKAQTHHLPAKGNQVAEIIATVIILVEASYKLQEHIVLPLLRVNQPFQVFAVYKYVVWMRSCFEFLFGKHHKEREGLGEDR